MPLPGSSTNAQRVCSAVGSVPAGGCATLPVIVVPARVGVTVPVASGTGDSSHLSVYVIVVALMFRLTISPPPAPPR
ncbi:Uncharacterised protein [Burkholderia pseudomallei]|nr:Uncharacterised protein [Burkholderia pseudomallei]